jgi:hypothetical protein
LVGLIFLASKLFLTLLSCFWAFEKKSFANKKKSLLEQQDERVADQKHQPELEPARKRAKEPEPSPKTQPEP